MGEFIVGTVGFIAVVMTAAAGWIVFDHHERIEDCKRQHNVYACHMVAVPSEKEDAR